MPDLAALLPNQPRQDLVLTFRAITPVYLHGPDPAQTSAQAASVRGALHRWLWMLLGGLQDATGNPLTTKDVAKAEASIFGTTIWGSDLSIKFDRPSPPAFVPEVDRQRFLYVGWPVANKDYWEAGTTFRIRIDAGPVVAGMGASNEAMALAACCWCWATLGWLGARGRRGFGALHLQSVSGYLAGAFADSCNGATATAVWCPPENLNDWQAFLASGLNGAMNAVAVLVPGTVAPTPVAARVAPEPKPSLSPPEWSAFASGYWRLLVTEYSGGKPAEPAWANALSALALRLRAFRQRSQDLTWPQHPMLPMQKTRDLNAMVTGLATPAPGLTINLRDDEFGLPRPYLINGARSAVEPAGGSNRRPSPVIARPIAHGPGGGEVAVAWLALRATFLPNGAGSRVTGQAVSAGATINVDPPPAGLPTIARFMGWLARDATATTHADLTS